MITGAEACRRAGRPILGSRCSSASPTEPDAPSSSPRKRRGSLNHNYIGTEHILLGLLREEEGVAAKALDEPRRLARGCSARRRGDRRPGIGGPPAATSRSPPSEEGPRALAARSAAARSQLHRNRAHPARADPRGRGRRGPGPAEARRRSQPGPPDRGPAPVRAQAGARPRVRWARWWSSSPRWPPPRNLWATTRPRVRTASGRSTRRSRCGVLETTAEGEDLSVKIAYCSRWRPWRTRWTRVIRHCCRSHEPVLLRRTAAGPRRLPSTNSPSNTS